MQVRRNLTLTDRGEKLLVKVSSAEIDVSGKDIEIARTLYAIKKGWYSPKQDEEDPIKLFSVNVLIREGYISESTKQTRELVDPWKLILPKYYNTEEFKVYSDEWDYGVTEAGKDLLDTMVNNPTSFDQTTCELAQWLYKFCEDEGVGVPPWVVRRLLISDYILKIPPEENLEYEEEY